MEKFTSIQFGIATGADTDAYPPLWVLLASPIVLIVSVLIAAAVFWQNQRTHTRARRMDTLVRILDVEMSDKYRLDHDSFVRVRDERLWQYIITAERKEDIELRRRVYGYLNHYEVVALGVQENLFSKKIYKKWMGSILVRDWNDSVDFVEEMRKTQPSLFVNFEQLAKDFDPDARNCKSID